MRKRNLIMGTTLALSLAAAGTAQASTNVQSLKGDWSASNSTVTKTPDGVHFGTYADGGALGGSLLYKGANGLKLSAVKDYSFIFNYKQAGNLTGAAPYARIFLDTDGDHQTDADVILDPSLGGNVLPVQGADINFGTADDSVRYGDDKGDSAQQSWAQVKADHPDDVITNVLVSQGNSMGTDVSAMVKSITFNGTEFDFDAAPLDGLTGTKGTNGVDGTNGTNGSNGVNGTNGAAGANGITTIVHDNGTLTGARMRTIHARKIKGAKFMSVRASLRGKRLPVRGRSVKVDLRGMTTGNYNVLLVAKYKKGGKIHTVRSIRSLSVTRS